MIRVLLLQIGPVGPDEKELVQKLGNNPLIGPWLVKPIIYRWARCQHATIQDQLKFGIRYFDLRVGKNGDKMCILHALYGLEVLQVLLDLKEFLDKHEQEVVILDLQHFYGLSPGDHQVKKILTFFIFRKKNF
jgi:hypothetical protein